MVNNCFHFVLKGLLPRGKTPNRNRERNEKVNEIVRNMASSVPKCEVLDIGKDLVQADGKLIEDSYTYILLFIVFT